VKDEVGYTQFAFTSTRRPPQAQDSGYSTTHGPWECGAIAVANNALSTRLPYKKKKNNNNILVQHSIHRLRGYRS